MPSKNLKRIIKNPLSKSHALQRKSNKRSLVNTESYEHLALGGTFDHFHKGHQHFVRKALNVAKKVIIGITSDEYAANIHKSNKLHSFKLRKKELVNFITKQNSQKKVKIITLDDPYGLTIKIKDLDSLLITNNTKAGGQLINLKRQELGLKKLQLINCQLQKAEDGKIISSHRIRNGEISRSGVHYLSQLSSVSPVIISGQLRNEYRKPFGKIFSSNNLSEIQTMSKVKLWIDEQNLNPIICVGDVVTSTFLQIGGKPNLKIIDLKVQRKKRYRDSSELGPIGHLPHYRVENQPGNITRNLINHIQKVLHSKITSVILVEGEEDLAVLPCILLSPLHSVILYGHFQYGIIAVEVSEEKKIQALKLLKGFN